MSEDHVLSVDPPAITGGAADDVPGEGEAAADLALPELMRRAMEKQGRVDPDEILAAAAVLDEIATPEEDAANSTPVIDPTGLRGRTCCSCGEQITFSDRGVLHEVQGWSKPRGDTGGINHVIGRRETGRMICGRCASLRKYGLPEGQQAIL